MLILKTTTSFRKDYKRMKKQGRDMSLLQKVIEKLLAENVLDKKYRDHALTVKICRIPGMPYSAGLAPDLFSG